MRSIMRAVTATLILGVTASSAVAADSTSLTTFMTPPGYTKPFASRSDTSGRADSSAWSDLSDRAVTAGFADSSWRADNTRWADGATRADTAGRADSTAWADRASRADSSAWADAAAKAGSAKVLWGGPTCHISEAGVTIGERQIYSRERTCYSDDKCVDTWQCANGVLSSYSFKVSQ
jgi:hypothetical protein